MKYGYVLVFGFCFLLSGCAMMPSQPTVTFPLKIGLLADSQITSQNGFSDFHYRSKTADALVDVSIRPPALEGILAPEMLHIALNKLTQDSAGTKKGVDVIFYLGDAANSGGTDEIDTALSILSDHRQQTGVPIFIVIGNHDYLGAGNIVSPGIRFAMLNQLGRPDNPPLTKYEVLKRFSDFNHASGQMADDRFRYTDNIDAVERNKDRDHCSGLFLCGYLSYNEPAKSRVDMLLMDTSDYKDAPDWSEVMSIGFYGVIGSVSFKDETGFVSQTGTLHQFAGSASPPFRFMVSHYPKDHLDRITFAKPGQVPLNVTNLAWGVTENAFSIPTFSKTLNQNLESLLTSEKGNYWLSGHTHVHGTPSPERFILGGLVGDKYVTALNVGSTTDYRAHVAIVEAYKPQQNLKLDSAIGYREIPLTNCDKGLLADLVRSIEDYGRQHADDPVFAQAIPTLNQWIEETEKCRGLLDVPGAMLRGLQKDSKADQVRAYRIDVGATLLGLNKTYQMDAWGDPQTAAAVDHFRQFINDFLNRTQKNRQEVVALLGLLSGAYENGLIPQKNSVELESLRRLCTTPM